MFSIGYCFSILGILVGPVDYNIYNFLHLLVPKSLRGRSTTVTCYFPCIRLLLRFLFIRIHSVATANRTCTSSTAVSWRFNSLLGALFSNNCGRRTIISVYPCLVEPLREFSLNETFLFNSVRHDFAVLKSYALCTCIHYCIDPLSIYRMEHARRDLVRSPQGPCY